MPGEHHQATGPEMLIAAGLDREAVAAWSAATPQQTTSYETDRLIYADFWQKSAALVDPMRSQGRSARDDAAVTVVVDAARRARTRFLRQHALAVYDDITGGRSRFVRVEDLVSAAADRVAGLVPEPRALAAEDGRLQRDRSGAEIDQGLLVSAVLADPQAGRHLCHAMLLPLPESRDLAAQFGRDGAVTLPGASVRRDRNAAVITYEHPRFLNAEDNDTLDAMEACVDVALLDPASEVVVLRGGIVAHPKYRGQRIFGAGINLTHLYHGRIPFVWYLRRDLGYVNKIYRGLAFADDAPPDEGGGASLEKPWIAAVERFAIGGHCQVLLVCDYVIAANDAFLTLPARREGIIPGAANLRMPRFAGDRITRQAILYGRQIPCDSPEGRLMCDEIVPPATMDEAIARVVNGLTGSGVVSAAGNRRAIRIGEEPLDAFRTYMAVYAREQAFCHFSPALIRNLEQHWNAQNRKP